MSITKGLRTRRPPQSWARGIWRGVLLRSPALPPHSPRHPPSLWVFLSPPALLSASPCRLSQPALVLLFLFLPCSPLLSAPPSPALGTRSPRGEAEGRNILMVPSVPLCHSEAHFSPPKKHLKFLIECIPVLSECLKRGLILGYIKGQTSTFIIFGHYI